MSWTERTGPGALGAGGALRAGAARCALTGLALVALAACGAKTGLRIDDAGPGPRDAGAPVDAGRRDAGARADASAPPDAPGWDAGPPELRCAEADFHFTVPLDEPAEPAEAPVEARAGVRLADVYVLIDTSGSMSAEIEALRGAVVEILGRVTCQRLRGFTCRADSHCPAGYVCGGGSCVEDPGAAGCVVSLWSGVGTYGAIELGSYRNRLAVQSDASATAARMPGSGDISGSTEDLYLAVSWIAEPPPDPILRCSSVRPTCPGYREDATRILLALTDEDSDGPTTATEAAAALIRERIVFAGIYSDTRGDAYLALGDLARRASASDDHEPLLFDGLDEAVVGAVTDALRTIIRERSLWIAATVEDLPGDDGDALVFVDRVELDTARAGCFSDGPTADRNGDGYDDAIDAPPGALACFTLVARDNVSVPPIDRTQIFLAQVALWADEGYLAHRTACFEVPALRE